MTSFLKHLTIDRLYTFSGDKEEMIALVKKSDLRYSFEGDNRIEFSPRVSFGIVGFFFIKVKLIIVKAGADQVRIRLATSVRPEHYFIALLCSVIIISGIVDGEDISTTIGVSIVWAIMHLWFHFIYRLQENSMARKIVEALHLKAGASAQTKATTLS
jgi:hypothetical protein